MITKEAGEYMNFRELILKKEYRSLEHCVVNDFYIPVLTESVKYRRAVGFFSSTSLIEISKGIGALLKNDGIIQLIASPKLSKEDILAIENGFERRHAIIEKSIIKTLTEPEGPFDEERLNLLSNLIALGKLEIKIAFLEKNNHIGMFHEKMGLMYDKNHDVIAFTGSMNESKCAFSHNYESIDVFTSWGPDADRVDAKENAFNAMWNDYEPHIRVMEFPNISKEIMKKYQRDERIQYDIDEREYSTHSFEKAGSSIKENEIEYIGKRPRVPPDVKIRDYQEEAIDNWETNNFCGIFDMATGTGKTYTALAAIYRLYCKLENKLGVIIVCPYQHLVEQWREDIEKFGMKPIVCYSSSDQRNWKQRLQTAVTSYTLGVSDHFCVISTNATFSSEYVQTQMSRLKDKVVLVVDEAHNFGAENLSKTLQPNIQYRLALSATINRHGDEEGTQKLFDYFGKVCIQYTLKEAINNDMLTPYYYKPTIVYLTETELAEYLEITRKIVSGIRIDKKGKSVLNNYAKMLLIKRARLVAGASAKIHTLGKLITSHSEDSHMLVYCGAATMKDYGYEENSAPIDEMKQINIVADLLGNQLGMRISKFTSEESSDEREIIKTEFAEGKHLQALIAIRCLDEGVNIPSIKIAFILASSTNPKEYIQRRGRVLRKYPGKRYATIYDFITLPASLNEIERYSEDAINSIKSLAIREVQRMKDFAEISENPSDADSLILEIVDAYNIQIDDEEGGLSYDSRRD